MYFRIIYYFLLIIFVSAIISNNCIVTFYNIEVIFSTFNSKALHFSYTKKNK